MSAQKEYLKNSTEGYLVLHMWSTEIKGSDQYFKNGKPADASIMKGCVKIKEDKYQKNLRYLKNHGKL